MSTNTIILIVIVAIIAVLLIAAIAWVARNKRTQHNRVEAGDIREKAAEQSHEVGQREALAEETAANARAARAEADAKAAHAVGLQHQAELHQNDAASAREEVNQEYDRADKIDPDTQFEDASRPDSTHRGAARHASNGKQGPPVVPTAR